MTFKETYSNGANLTLATVGILTVVGWLNNRGGGGGEYGAYEEIDVFPDESDMENCECGTTLDEVIECSICKKNSCINCAEDWDYIESLCNANHTSGSVCSQCSGALKKHT